MFVVASDGGDYGIGTNNLLFHDLIVDNINIGPFAPSQGAGGQWGLIFEIVNDASLTQGPLQGITINHVTGIAFQTGFTGGLGPGVGFAHQSAIGSTIANLKIINSIFPAGFNRDIKGVCGTLADATSVLNCIASIGGAGTGTFCVDHNALATSTLGTNTRTNNNAPYPSAGQSTNCGFTSTGNLLPASYAAIGF